MPPEIIGVFDLGTTTIPTSRGPALVGVISIRTSENESAPVDYIGHCRLHYKETIIKNLKRIHWLKPPEVVIPAQAGIQEQTNQEEAHSG